MSASSRMPPSHMRVAWVCRRAWGVTRGLRTSARSQAREQLGERGIGQRLAAAPAMAADEEKEGGASVARALERHVVGDRGERGRFVQVDDALAASLGAHPARMVLAMAHDNALAA